jgi:hypothetical protein
VIDISNEEAKALLGVFSEQLSVADLIRDRALASVFAKINKGPRILTYTCSDKITAIKIWRFLSGMPLKESKDAVDHQAPTGPYLNREEKIVIKFGEVSQEKFEQVQRDMTGCNVTWTWE